MCGRFTNALTWEQIYRLYQLTLDAPMNLRPRYNIAPTQDVLAIVDTEEGRRAVVMRWGLVPFWAKEIPKASTFNARAEGIAEKPMWRDPFRKRRCIVVADGFYEWTGKPSDRQPVHISRADGEPLSFAGLWDRNTALGIVSCTIVITEANRQMRDYHDRMPVILEPGDIGRWLAEPDAGLLKPSRTELRIHPVSKAVNNVRNEGPDLAQPMGQDLLPGLI
ncbi:MAG: SOS response-associated peptidase [Sphingomonadales bacterium]